MKLTIIELYPSMMNLYGDSGNARALRKRLQWRGIEAIFMSHEVGNATDFSQADILLGGGGQDSNQDAIHHDLLSHRDELASLTEAGLPTLLICGLYQLFGRSFVTTKQDVIAGAAILPIETRASNERLVGNITVVSPEFGSITGYENHSGQTFLDSGSQPLGQVTLGAGNNSREDHEGIRYHNLIGTYLHGPILPRNPQIADFLIEKALERQGYQQSLESLAIDQVAERARQTITQR